MVKMSGDFGAVDAVPAATGGTAPCVALRDLLTV